MKSKTEKRKKSEGYCFYCVKRLFTAITNFQMTTNSKRETKKEGC